MIWDDPNKPELDEYYDLGMAAGRLEVVNIIKDLQKQSQQTSLGALVWTSTLLELIDDLTPATYGDKNKKES
tara:strand:+ start:3090 stop:3305 length:216 start_codon:yes stop_codon:yes gene_type:complete